MHIVVVINFLITAHHGVCEKEAAKKGLPVVNRLIFASDVQLIPCLFPNKTRRGILARADTAMEVDEGGIVTALFHFPDSFVMVTL